MLYYTICPPVNWQTAHCIEMALRVLGFVKDTPIQSAFIEASWFVKKIYILKKISWQETLPADKPQKEQTQMNKKSWGIKSDKCVHQHVLNKYDLIAHTTPVKSF